MVSNIISDDEIKRVHGNANFGGMSPREVVNKGVVKYSMDLTGGSTQIKILREHGLITNTKGYRASLTVKGKMYLKTMVVGKLDRIMEILNEE